MDTPVVLTARDYATRAGTPAEPDEPTPAPGDPGTRIRHHLMRTTRSGQEWWRLLDIYLDAHPDRTDPHSVGGTRTAGVHAHAVVSWYRRLIGDTAFAALHDETSARAVVADRIDVLNLLAPALEAYVAAHADPTATWRLWQTAATELRVNVHTVPLTVLQVPVDWVCAYHAAAAPVAAAP